MKYSQKYGIHLYEQYTQNLLDEISTEWIEKKAKDKSFNSEMCKTLRYSLYGTTKIEEFKMDYHEYLNDLVKRSTMI